MQMPPRLGFCAVAKLMVGRNMDMAGSCHPLETWIGDNLTLSLNIAIRRQVDGWLCLKLIKQIEWRSGCLPGRPCYVLLRLV